MENQEDKKPMTPEQLRERIIDELHTVFDPEIPVDIYELGLIYKVEIMPINNVMIEMTLTSPMCPVAETMPQEVKDKVAAIPEVNDVQVEVVFDPPWDQSMMSEAAQLELGFM
jgi:FeS assembly SUF system protein